ncbi:protein MEI2-like 2 [Impatiens glandulifera]|uniref:protein MEI2-like 2 n=1 Tax=Impatiens glandulifera TaxID=253017 RepID=UPI001FB0AD08|nr:protein MEI2-like 2 [Impatiens glandulifera]
MSFLKEEKGKAKGRISLSSFNVSSDVSLFSSSLPVLPHDDLKIGITENMPLEPKDADNLLDELAAIGSLLPDEDELFAGMLDDLELTYPVNQMDDVEEYDLFGSGGGMELESDLQDIFGRGLPNLSLSDVAGNGVSQFSFPNGTVTVAGEHPFGEHPSRTLFVRNINSNIDDSEIRSLFEQYGDIRTLYTACKHRGFVMISYYDIRDARNAMRSLQGKPLRRRKLDIHFSIPKDNPSDKDINQGTLVVFNLDPSVSNDDLLQIFGAYGEIKEIRETPHKRHHKFIEFYDVRAAEAALRSLNRSDIAGKRIKLEPSRPGGARRNLMMQINPELEPDESRSFRLQIGSPIANSPPGNWPQMGSPIEHSLLQTLGSSPNVSNNIPGGPGLASILHPQVQSPICRPNSVPIRGFHMNTTSNNNGIGFQQSHSLSDSNEKLSGPQFLWGSPASYNTEKVNNSSGWQMPSSSSPSSSLGQTLMPSIPYGTRQVPFHGLSHHNHNPQSHYVGSAPSGIPFERHLSYRGPSAFGGMSLERNETSFLMNMGGGGSGLSDRGTISQNGSPNVRMMSSSPRINPVYLGNSYFPGLGPTNMDSLIDRGRNRRTGDTTAANQFDNKKQFQLELDKIRSGEDIRTTLMIKNIPNKYTSKMLLAAIDEKHRGAYDFLYLPIDFKNKCNVGYAFINMLSPWHIVSFYESFNGKKWEKFNSEKVANLAYARIQGKVALVAHFQNSSLMNEDKRCRPILFHSDGSEIADQVIQEQYLPMNGLNMKEHKTNGVLFFEDYSSGSSSSSRSSNVRGGPDENRARS